MRQNDRYKSRAGFTLIELLVFVGIFTLIVGSFIAILVSVINIQTQQVAIGEVEQQGQFVAQQLQYYIQNARLVDMVVDTATSTLVLRESNPSLDPITFTLSTGTVYLTEGTSGTPQVLTSNKVTISNMSFTRHYNLNSSSSAQGTESVSYSFTITAGNGPDKISQTFQSSVQVLAPVNKIALIQQAKGEFNNTGATSISVSYPTENDAGDLLLAVVANQGIVTSSIADTNGNAWTLLTSTTYPSYSQKLALYMATSSNLGFNTTTVTFAPHASYASVYLYEYRGASTSTPADVWAAQTQGGTATPSSGLVNPTSSVELLLGVNFNGNTTEVPSAGSGYTLETSSTANNSTQVFAEDQVQYISGPVSAGWTYITSTPSSSAMIATFK